MAIMLDENRTRPHRGAGTQPRHRTAVVLDTRPFVLEIVKGVLDRSEIVTLARHTSADAAIETIRTRRPDLFIVELGGGERDAFALASIREARDLAPGIKAIVLVDTSDEQAVQAAFGAGAVAAVSRVCRVDDLAFAVRHAFEPSIYLAQGPGAAHARSYGVGGDELSRREREILQLVAEGHSNERVARQLWVAEQTVKFHLTNIYRKLGVANRTEASRWAHENGLLTDTPAPAALARIAHGSIEPSLPPRDGLGSWSELTRREREILQLVAMGHSNRRVARRLWVTEQTVKFHLSNVYRKLDVTNRTEASRRAQQAGLLADEPLEQCAA